MKTVSVPGMCYQLHEASPFHKKKRALVFMARFAQPFMHTYIFMHTCAFINSLQINVPVVRNALFLCICSEEDEYAREMEIMEQQQKIVV